MDHRVIEEHAHEVGQHGVRWLRSRYAEWILAAISFAESVIAPILIDPFLIALILADRSKWLRYTIISIIFSLLGGVVAYVLGALFFESIGEWLIATYGFGSRFDWIAAQLNSNGFAFVLLGELTPIPYKLVALASGLLSVDPLTFIVASVFGRILRLGLVGYAAYAVGPHALPIVRRHLLTFAYVCGALLIIYIGFRLI